MPMQKITAKFKKDSFEHAAWNTHKIVVGIDEVGRGCLAGPVVTAAVALCVGALHPLIKDSKLLNRRDLEKAYDWIVSHSSFAVASGSHLIIDHHNIYQATRIVMEQALMNVVHVMGCRPYQVLIDAVPLAHNTGDFDVYYFNKGESKSSSIAAASIVAKVTRDRLMEKLDTLFPVYGFAHHKGYATLEHRIAVEKFGKSAIHRTSFTLENGDSDEQTSLF